MKYEVFMKVYLLKDVEKVGFAGEIIKVKDGYAQNFLFPRKLGVQVTAQNSSFYESRVKNVEHRKEALASEQSMLSEKINQIVVTLKKKAHDDNKLYASISPSDIVDALAEQGVKISKNQVKFDKSVKTLGEHKVTIKLSSKLQPQLTVKINSL